MTSPEAKGPKVPPSHPPRTPPPQKKPVEPPRPQPATKSANELPLRTQPRMVVRNRRTAAHPFRADEWAPTKAVRQVLETVRGWGYPALDVEDLESVVRLLVTAAVADGGKRLSVHLGDQDQKVLVAVLSHATGALDQTVLGTVAALATVDSVGTDTGEDGRRMWAVLDGEPRRRPVHHAAATRS
ncbi:hypothetical protein AB4039_04655 [Streptomyces sp. M-16]|uniref:hypothetical protein n=1 Tax=Streptomyces sp. M-16 TaxID=3233040 RepID=UPI00225B8765